MIRYYKHYHGTGFGKASTAAVRNFRCPIKTIMQGDANPKSRRTQDAQTESTPPPPPADTTDVHAHAAHSDAEDNVCACCADQPSKCVQFTATESLANSRWRRKWLQTSGSGGTYNRRVGTTISSGGASSGGASSVAASLDEDWRIVCVGRGRCHECVCVVDGNDVVVATVHHQGESTHVANVINVIFARATPSSSCKIKLGMYLTSKTQCAVLATGDLRIRPLRLANAGCSAIDTAGYDLMDLPMT